jgi:hypothetical protein
MPRACEANVRGTDAKKNVEGEIILQKKDGSPTYKMAGQCGDGGQRLKRRSRGQSRLEESDEGSQIPPRAVVPMMMVVTETCLEDSFYSYSVCPDGYSVRRVNRDSSDFCLFCSRTTVMDRDSLVGIATRLRVGRSGHRIPLWARFSATVQSGPAAHPGSCTMGTGFLSGE